MPTKPCQELLFEKYGFHVMFSLNPGDATGMLYIYEYTQGRGVSIFATIIR